MNYQQQNVIGSQGGYGETGAGHGTGAQNSQKENTRPIVIEEIVKQLQILARFIVAGGGYEDGLSSGRDYLHYTKIYQRIKTDNKKEEYKEFASSSNDHYSDNG